MPEYLHFGAGNIGRALAGPLFSRAGYRVVFVDAVPSIVAALQQRKRYRVVVKDTIPAGESETFEVCGVDGISVEDAEAVRQAVARADLIGTAVGAAHLPDVLTAIASGLPLRNGRPVSILFCENLNGLSVMAREVLTRALPPGFLMDRVGLVETSIGKMVPLMPAEVRERDPLEVWGEAYNVIIADRNGFAGPVPEGVEGLELKSCFQAYVERKLYIHNLGHATCACHGFLRGHTRICEAMADAAVVAETRQVMQVSARALIRRYPSEFSEANQTAHVEDLLRRFGNRALGDTVFRVGRDLPRKLAPGDRFIGGLRLAQAEGEDPAPVCRAIAAALHFAAVDETGHLFPADAAFRERLAREGAEALLSAHSGLDPIRDREALNLILGELKPEVNHPAQRANSSRATDNTFSTVNPKWRARSL
ncbi:MAG TPA: mannitol-1-phosphate 5-dehydrogenase [Kiritimatiellia bacterium]|jgi:mannitol-1-phosphate 5-dehydrogenase|nr:mannitol-1-phosphate 5-dehydrogenase [Kiritimatiellia bacterium]HOR97896.1 mannitol-1-phosphate 5-dehydrogenase [Kiritimatiellia bacterium]HPK36836.1 mannitol-1-phosphate 5-dehydrogenase [Kiritimatiellia bacterium]HPW75879.1 mannitol-1-phosphate 5-dehydrogenase [Kiritimatiellia bacterium]HRU20193.1 mannitol-1-phosphate 5-dehydrogenase [Kiritimatiellia bacterium]